MKTLQRSILGLGFALALSALADTNSLQAPRLKGTVVDSAGRPVAGASVECPAAFVQPGLSPHETPPFQRVLTDANGTFALEWPRGGGVVLARKPGLAPAWRQSTAAPAEDLRLVLTPPTILAGRVVDETDKPVVGAEVSVAVAISETVLDGGRRSYGYLMGKQARECFIARTTADGRFRIEGFPTNASADLSVRASGKAFRQERRESLGPDTMACHSGQEDIRLVMEAASSVEGRIVIEGVSHPLPIAHLTLQPDGGGFYGTSEREPVESDENGAFRIPDVAGGSYRIRTFFGTNAVPDWVAEPVAVSVDTGQTNRDVRIPATQGGLLEIAVLIRNERRPQSQANINAYKEGYQAGASSSSNGLALLRLPPGQYRISVTKQGARAENTSASVAAGQTNRVEIEMTESPKITGIVRRPDGQPAAGLEVRIVGAYAAEGSGARTGADGKFEVVSDAQMFGRSDRTLCLLIRDPERNLAVAQDIDEDTGPLDLRLAPGISFTGRAECDGKPVTNATATLVFWTGNSGMHLPGLSTGTNTPGRFELGALPPGRKYGLYITAPGYGQRYITPETEAEAGRIEIDPAELKPANLKLAGQVVDADDKPIAGANVNLYGEGQPSANTRTDREGRFSFAQVCEGQVRLSASARSSHGSTVADGGETNVVLKLGESTSTYAGSTNRKIKGIVTDPDGKPVAGAQVTVFPDGGSRWVKTGTNGAFNLTWSIQPWQLQSGGDPCLVVRDTAHNLAASLDLAEDTTNVTVKLEPALTLTGRVEGADGAPLTNAQVGVQMLACRSYSSMDNALPTTDARGTFELKAFPPGRQYIAVAIARGHGRLQTTIEPEAETKRVELPPFVLNVANQVLIGQVLNPSDKPVSGVQVSLSGEGQPEGSATTDAKGRFSFKVCEGTVRLFASGQTGYANTTAEAGDTNVVIQLSQSGSSVRESPRRASLQGKPLPSLAPLGFAADAAPAGKALLLCLLDAEQRPSRRAARLLVEQHDALRQKGLSVLAIQAIVTDAQIFRDWTNANPMPFPAGQVANKSAGTKWVTDAASLPWFILRDAQGKVAAEGFALDELDAKLQALKK